jgi:putative methionine-R-sulfoxide reductase with GAF domain
MEVVVEVVVDDVVIVLIVVESRTPRKFDAKSNGTPVQTLSTGAVEQAWITIR